MTDEVKTGRLLVLLDRDGVINENRADYVKSREEFAFLPGALDALRLLAQHEARVVVVSNQSAVGRGIISAAALESINLHMREQVEGAGGRIDAVLCCPHAPDEGCDCRKPRPGLLLEAMRLLPGHDYCYAIGDSLGDLLAARAAGVPFIMVLTGKGREALSHRSCAGAPSWIAADLTAAVRGMLRHVSVLQREVAA